MTRFGFGEGVLVALLAAMLASVAQTGLGLLLPAADVGQLLCIGLGFGYGLYLLARSREHLGRIVVAIGWVAVSFLVVALTAGLWPQVLAQLVLVWLTRVFYYHTETFAALVDLGLLVLGFLAAIWVLERTGSLFLTIWMFLLVQALFPLIPSRPDGGERADPPQDPFVAAEHTAEHALRRLSARQ